MKKLLLYGFIGFIGLAFLIGGLRACFPKDPNQVKVEKPIVIKPFEKMTLEEKQNEIDSFISYKKYKEQFSRLNDIVIEGTKKMVKYPETLEIQFNNEEFVSPSNFVLVSKNIIIENLEKGKLAVIVDFKGENSYGTKVRNRLFLSIKFNQDKNFDILDTTIN